MSRAKPAPAADVDHDTTADAPVSFEAALVALEQVVQRLEKGDLALEDSLVAYEQGVRLVVAAKGKLDGMQSRLEQLLADGSTSPLKRASDANKPTGDAP